MSTVVWDESALDRLADIWVQATPADRIKIDAAVQRINRTLLRNPDQQGESRPANLRILIVPPLAVLFRVTPPDLATVTHVWLPRTRTRP